MLIPNKFSGYQAGIRVYPGGGGGPGTGNFLVGLPTSGGSAPVPPSPPPPPPTAPWGTTQQSKADYYNQQLGAGLNDAQIRANVEANSLGGPQSDANWSQLVQTAGMRSPTGRPLAGSGQFYQPQYQPQYQNYANPYTQMGVSQYGQSFGGMPQMQTPFSMFGGQMQGGGYGQYGTNNPYSPYSNTFLNMPTNLQGATADQKADVYRDAMSRGFNDQQMRNQATGLYGPQSDQAWGWLQGLSMGMSPGLAQGTEQNKIDFYNQAQNQGYSDSVIRNAANQMIGQQSQGDWNYLQGKANYGGVPQMQTPFRSSGPSQAIVARSAGARGTPNVIRRAEGGIASLVDEE